MNNPTLEEKKRRREILLDSVMSHKDAPYIMIRELKRAKIYKPKDQDERSFLRGVLILYPLSFVKAVNETNKQLEFLK